MSLTIEALFSDLIGILMRIPKKESRTIGNKSTAFSLRSKVDFLFDLGKLTKEECKDLQIFMEIRNQLMHNSDIDTMMGVLDITENKKRIEQYLELDNDIDYGEAPSLLESIYRAAFSNFYGKILACIERVLHTIAQEIALADEQKEKAAEHALLNKHFEFLSDAIDEASDAFDKVFDRTEGEGGALKKSIQARFYIKLKEAYPNQNIPLPGSAVQ